MVYPRRRRVVPWGRIEHATFGQSVRDCRSERDHPLRISPSRISRRLSTAAADPGMSTGLRSVGLLDVLSSTPAEPSVARPVSMPVCAAAR